MLCTALCGGIDEYSLSQTDGASSKSPLVLTTALVKAGLWSDVAS